MEKDVALDVLYTAKAIEKYEADGWPEAKIRAELAWWGTPDGVVAAAYTYVDGGR